MGIGRAAFAAGISQFLLRCELDPDYRRRKALTERRRKLNYQQHEMTWKQKYQDSGQTRARAAAIHERIIHASSDLLAERDRRLAVPYETFTAEFFGDPRPGFSALDKKRAQGISK